MGHTLSTTKNLYAMTKHPFLNLFSKRDRFSTKHVRLWTGSLFARQHIYEQHVTITCPRKSKAAYFKNITALQYLHFLDSWPRWFLDIIYYNLNCVYNAKCLYIARNESYVTVWPLHLNSWQPCSWRPMLLMLYVGGNSSQSLTIPATTVQHYNTYRSQPAVPISPLQCGRPLWDRLMDISSIIRLMSCHLL